jgi:hypothetical protein
MDLKRLANRAKEFVDKRGGTESVKEDAGELKDIATGQGSLSDKAKEAVEAVKDPGAAGEEVGKRVEEAAPDEPPAEAGERQGRRRERKGRRREGVRDQGVDG